MELTVETFSGIGTQAYGLEYLGVPHERVAICDIVHESNEAYWQVHGEVPNLGDITKVEQFPAGTLFTYSFPCTDISLAGKQKGLQKGSGTRSSLLWECERAIEQQKYEVLLLENVEMLGSAKYKTAMSHWFKILEDLGYTNYAFFANAKDYGLPQNRPRYFVVSVRKDIDIDFEIPMPEPLYTCVNDILELNVDERYFLDVMTVASLTRRDEQHSFTDNQGDIVIVGYINGRDSQSNKVYSPKGISPCLTTGKSSLFEIDGRIRYLTPRECWRLMGIKDVDIDKVYNFFINKYGVAKTDELMYFEAGNAISVEVLKRIFYQIYKHKYELQAPSEWC